MDGETSPNMRLARRRARGGSTTGVMSMLISRGDPVEGITSASTCSRKLAGPVLRESEATGPSPRNAMRRAFQSEPPGSWGGPRP